MASRGLDNGTTTRKTVITSYFERTTKDKSKEADELSMPMIISDVLKPARPKIKNTLPMAESPQTPKRTGQQTALSEAGPSQSPSQMRLAVHIRSSPLTPFTPINSPASREPSTLPARLGRTRGRPASSQTPTRQPTPDPLADLGTKVEEPSSGPKKRGRPKGWKPGTPYTTDPNSRYRKREMRAAQAPAQAQVQERSTGQYKGPGQKPKVKRRGRPPRPLEPSVREQYLRSKPEYTPYKCEWEMSEDPAKQGSSICPAELQNMDTLRRHVFLIHGDVDLLTCRFSHCKDQNPPLKFETDEEFEHHMETRHFVAYLWHMGEGYQNNGIETVKIKPKMLPTYLFDEHGNQVTPSVTDQKLETDLQHKERRRKLRRLLYEQNENAPSEEEWRKQMMGIVVEGQNEV
ncbi:hypothetical protein F4680DRAFT_416682 [Xylaria scruposa]|nr:hypothetical protein F4680DRAFT_416682 [Xylaria scruposa]